MKKVFRIILCSCALFALASCVNEKTPSESSKSIEPSSPSIEPSSSTPTEIYYRVVFQNFDGTVLEEKDVLEGSKAIYSGVTPTKDEDDEFTYEFQGWDKEEELNVVKSDVTTKAVFKAVAKEGWGEIIWF